MPGFINEHLSNGKLVFEILPFTHRPLITRRCSFAVVPETTPLALRILAKQKLRMRKVCTHLEHICVKNVLQCSFMHDSFTHFGYDCATGCLQNEGACLFQSM